MSEPTASPPALQLEQWITARWTTERRYYVAEVGQDLFGTWQLKRSWGALRSHRGNSITIQATAYAHALQLFNQVEKRRLARGYVRST